MEPVDKSAKRNQLLLPAIPANSDARIIPLPLPASAVVSRQPQVARAKQPAPVVADLPDKSKATLWYACCFPQLAECPASQQTSILNELAGRALDISATVSLHTLALVCEIRSSLNYFGGIDTLHNKFSRSAQQCLAESGLPEDFLYAASPTVTGSLLLAKSGNNVLVYRKDNLRTALGQLPASVLELNKEQSRRLYNMGVRYLRDIWRLPTDGLRKRFGSEFVNLLNRALGVAPDPTQNYLPPPAFATSYDLPFEIENLDRLLPVSDEMLAQLCDFMRRRDLSTSRIRFSLFHEKRDCTSVVIGLRQPSRNREHLLMLLETRFSHLSIPAAVIAIRLEAEEFDAFMSHSDTLLLTGKSIPGAHNNTSLNRFIEQLQARIGDHRVLSITHVAEHCPEYACNRTSYTEILSGKKSRVNDTAAVTPNPRPFWLLPEPLQLTVRARRLYHRKPITIVHGPERIETRWWSGEEIQRDYYIGREANGSRLWIYRERSGARNWYLHGFFA